MSRNVIVLSASLAIGSGAVAVACGSFGGDNGASATNSPQDSGAMTADGSSVQDMDGSPAMTTSDAGAVDATFDAAPLCASPTTESFDADADAVLANSSDQALGDQPIVNVNAGFGVGVMRFTLSKAAANAFSSMRVVTATLTLRRVQKDGQCDSASGGCTGPSFAADGEMVVAPLRTDWTELQVTWIHTDKAKGSSWASPGAAGVGSDRDNNVGDVQFKAADMVTTISLAPILPKWIANSEIAFVVSTNSGKYLYTTHESTKSPTTMPQAAEKLTVTYCP